MNHLVDWIPLDTAERVGWTLLHSLWQGLLVAGLLSLVLRLLSPQSARLRYAVAGLSLICLLAASFLTWSLYPDASGQDSVREGRLLPNLETVVAAPLSMEPEALHPQKEIRISWLADHSRWIAGGWLLGMLLFSFRWAGSYWWIYRLKRRQVLAAGACWQAQLDKLARQVGIRRPVRLLISPRVDVPMLIGHLKPVILVPVGMLSGMAPLQVEAVLLHELMHVRRWDFIVNLFQSMVEVLFFYHPACWWISSQMRLERERCCDTAVVGLCGDAHLYVNTLVNMESKRQMNAHLALGLLSGRNQLLTRIRYILQPQIQQESPAFTRWVAWIVLLGSLAMLAWLPQSLDQHPAPTFSIHPQEGTLALSTFLQPVKQTLAVVDTPPPPPPPPPTPDAPEPPKEEPREPAPESIKEEVIIQQRAPAPPAFPELPTPPSLPEMPEIPEGMDDQAWIQSFQAEMQKFQAEMGRYQAELQQSMAKLEQSMARQWEELAGMEASFQEEEMEQRMKAMQKEYEQMAEAMERKHREMEIIIREEARKMDRQAREMDVEWRQKEEVIIHNQKEREREMERVKIEAERAERDMRRVEQEMLKKEREMSRKEVELQRRMEIEEKRMLEMEQRHKELNQTLERNLEQDGLISQSDKKVELLFENGEIRLNGKKLPTQFEEKYRDMLREYIDLDCTDCSWQMRLER